MNRLPYFFLGGTLTDLLYAFCDNDLLCVLSMRVILYAHQWCQSAGHMHSPRAIARFFQLYFNLFELVLLII